VTGLRGLPARSPTAQLLLPVLGLVDVMLPATYTGVAMEGSAR
jgi:hypothetical protein